MFIINQVSEGVGEGSGPPGFSKIENIFRYNATLEGPHFRIKTLTHGMMPMNLIVSILNAHTAEESFATHWSGILH